MFEASTATFPSTTASKSGIEPKTKATRTRWNSATT